MQKLQRNFVESKMNKDLDDRFVPAGEYRDAHNISVVTNTDSSSGAVQNSKGNTAMSSLSKNIETFSTVDGATSSSTTITFTEANEVLQPGMFLSSITAQPNLLTNGDFETPFTAPASPSGSGGGWTFYQEGGGNHGFTHTTTDGTTAGGYLHRGVNGGTASYNCYIGQNITVVSGQIYIASYRKKQTGGSLNNYNKTTFYSDLDNDGSANTFGTVYENSGEWVTKSVEFTTSFSGTLLFKLYMHSDGQGYLDDIVVKKKEAQPIITSVSDDKKTITINTPLSFTDGEVVYFQYSKMLPNECVGSIDDESEGSIYWMTSSRDGDESRQFNFRNVEQRSNVNLVTNGNFKLGTATDFYTLGWEYTEDHLTVSNATTGDDYITVQSKTGSTAQYPLFYSQKILLEQGRTYKVAYNIATMTYAGGTATPKVYIHGTTDPYSNKGGNGSYRPFYDNLGLDAGDREFYFTFDNRFNEGSNYMRLQVELTQPAGGYAGSSSNKLLKVGRFEITEYDADVAVYQDTIFEYKNNVTEVVCNDIYMLEMPHSAPQFTSSANTTTSDATVMHNSVTEEMLWDIIAKNDNDNGVPHVPYNPLTHAGTVKSVVSAELVKDYDFTDSSWSDGTIGATGQAGTPWNLNDTGVAGTGAGTIAHLSDTIVFNQVANTDSLAQQEGVALRKSRNYTITVDVASITQGGIYIRAFDGDGYFLQTGTITPSWGAGKHQFNLSTWQAGGGLYSSISIVCSTTTTAVINSVSIKDTHSLDIAVLEPYSGTAVEFPTDATAYKLRLFKPKVLNFNTGTKITGINIVDKMLYWTDGYSEPKKINIENSKLGTGNLYSQTRVHAPKNHESISRFSFMDDGIVGSWPPSTSVRASSHHQNGTYALGGVTYQSERNLDLNVRSSWAAGHSSSIDKITSTDISVIRRAPFQPPTLQKFDNEASDPNKLPYIKFKTTINHHGHGGHQSTAYKILIEGQKFNFHVNGETNKILSSVVAGDVLYVKADIGGTNFADPDLKLLVNNWSSTNNTYIYTTVLWIKKENPANFSENQPYTAVKYDNFSLYNDRFVRFAYRYKYQDGEYSTFSPWSHTAFIAGTYHYDSEVGINLGMMNKLKSLLVKGFVPPNMPADVVAIDLLYKDSSHNNVYKVSTFTKADPEWNQQAYGSTSVQMRHRGVYSIANENLQGALPTSQLLRSWDAVPKKAVAQEIIGNRLVYGNYTQNYDFKSNGEEIVFNLETTIGETLITGINLGDLSGVASCKSLRSYQVGVVYGDKYGRETPILTHASGAVTSAVGAAGSRLLLQSKVSSNAPSWAEYYKYYVKETSADFHNLVLDRWYANDDDTLWLSFFSHDVNKLMEGDEIILKKKHGSTDVVHNATRTKVLSIKEEAPEITKQIHKKIATYDAMKVGYSLRGTAYGAALYAIDHGTYEEKWGFYGTKNGNALPDITRSGDINPGDSHIDFTVDGWEASELIGLEENFWALAPNEQLVFYVQRYGLTSKKYRVTNIQKPIAATGVNTTLFDDKYRITLEKAFEDDIEFCKTGRHDVDSGGVYEGGVLRSYLELEFYVETYQLTEEHEGRFFVKVENTSDMRKYIMCAGRNTKRAEIMEMRLPYLAHNANYWSDGKTGISTTDPNEIPFTNSGAGGYNASHKSSVDYHVHKWHGGSLDSVTANRGAAAPIANEPSNSATFTGGHNILGNTSMSATNLLAMRNNSGNLGATASTTCEGVLMRGPEDWEDYCTRWGNDPTNPQEFLFVDKEPYAGCRAYWSQFPIKEGVDHNITYGQLIPGGIFQGTESWFQGGNWEPIYSTNGSTTIPYNKTPRFDPSTDVRPGPANNWTDNSPWQYYYPTTKTGGKRTYDYPDQSWYSNSGTNGYLHNNVKVDNNAMRQFDGRDKNNSPGYQGLSTVTPWGCDGGEKFLTVSHIGTRQSMRIKQFYYRVYSQIVGWDPQNEGAGIAESRRSTVNPQQFFWKEDPDKEIYTIISVTHNRWFKNYDVLDNGNAIPDDVPNTRYILALYLDKPTGSGPSGWQPFYHAQTNKTGAIDAGTNWAQPWYNSSTGAAASLGASGALPCPEYRTMVLLDTIVDKSSSTAVANPAVFETIPQKEQELDIYWEAGGAIPIAINGINGMSMIPYMSTNSTVEIDYINLIDLTASGGPAAGASTTQSLQITDIGTDGKITLSGPVAADVLINDVVRIFKPDSESIDYISYTLRIDPSTNNYIYLNNAVHGGWNSVPFTNCINFKNGVESRSIKDLFNGEQMSNGVVASTTIADIPKEEKYENSLIYSGIYNSKTGMNDFNQFIIADKITKDINPNYGSIQKLNTRDADMTILCEHKILKMLVNKNSLYNADGTTNITTSDLVLGQDVPYVGEYGISKNPESFISHGYKAFFTDRNRGAVIRLSQDGLTTISKNGMESYFDTNLRGKGFIIGTYDTKKYEYNVSFTLPSVEGVVNFNNDYSRVIELTGANSKIIAGMYVSGTNIQPGSIVESVNGATITIDRDTLTGGAAGSLVFAERTTVSFNDVSNGWSSFRSFVPEEGLSVRGEYFTYKDGTLFQHYTNDKANYYYGKPYSSSITAIFNDGPEVVKDFKTLEYLGTLPKNLPTEYGWYISLTKTDLESGYVGSFKEKESKWFGYIKGFDTGYTDPKQFTTQGIGVITKIETV